MRTLIVPASVLLLAGAALAQETVPGVGQGGSTHNLGTVPNNGSLTSRLSGSSTGASGQPLEGEHRPGGAIGASGGTAGTNGTVGPGSAMPNAQTPNAQAPK